MWDIGDWFYKFFKNDFVPVVRERIPAYKRKKCKSCKYYIKCFKERQIQPLSQACSEYIIKKKR